MLGSSWFLPKAVSSVYLSKRLTWLTVILFGILGQLSAHFKAVSIFRCCYFLILFYMKLIPFDTYLAFLYIVLFSFGVTLWQKMFYILYVFPTIVLLSALTNLFFCSYAYYKNNVIYNFSLPLFLLSLLHTFNFIYSYVPFCVCEYICFLTLWILFEVRHFYNGILLSCSVLSSGSYVNVQNQFSFFFFIFFLHFFIPFVFTLEVYDFLQFNIHTSKSSTFKIYKNNGAIFDLAI